ncbi:MAG: SCP2 sterol-binding domain-containing protein [Lachnospiraceae bacterium]|nr:SCP2 sterol-binding domain-containing protein [Lachnospiraceae bacterium]
MKVNIYYGGRGIMDDPTLYVINKMQTVLEELHVTVERFNLYELKNNIVTLPQTIKTADGIILATTVEWYGIGGYMQQFLDACWLYGDKEKIAKTYMCPVVMSTTYGEREGKLNLATAWEILGGLPCSGLCGYIADAATLEVKEDYITIIEKKAENMYRTINQKLSSFPASNQAVKQKISITKNYDLTPQESEQLSQYASDDTYVQKQKEDIQELTSLFKNLMEGGNGAKVSNYVDAFKKCFKPVAGFKASYNIIVGDNEDTVSLRINQTDIQCEPKALATADVEVSMGKEAMEEILSGNTSFQLTFMSGAMKLKGDFMVLRTLDQLFPFTDQKKQL